MNMKRIARLVYIVFFISNIRYFFLTRFAANQNVCVAVQ
jgi:hypothetical protein